MAAARRWRVVHLPSVDSTQDEARRRLAAEGPSDRVAVVADEQHAGVGRFRRPFDSPRGGAWQTLIVAYEGRAAPPALAPAVAASVAAALAERGREVGVKWPNDLYRGGAKCGGVLIERVPRQLLIGVGINATNPVPEDRARVDLPAGEVAALVRAAVDEVLRDEGAAALARWDRHDLLRGRHVVVGGVGGVAEGVDAEGRLLLRLPGGGVRAVTGGSVGEVDPPLGRPQASGSSPDEGP